MPALLENKFQKHEVTFTLYLPEFMKTAGLKGATGLLTSVLVDVHPLSGFIFASTHSVMQELLEPGVEKLLTDKTNLPSRVYLFVVTFFASAVVSISMTIALGFTISFTAAVWLSVFMIPASYAIEHLFQKYVKSKPSE